MHVRHLARLLAGSLCACVTCVVAAQAVGGTRSTASEADVNFIERAASDGAAEVQLGQLALGQSSNDQVKQLAQHMVDDRARANEDLRALAHAKQVSLPTPPDGAGASVAGFKDKNGTEFDQAWTDGVVKDHQKAIGMFTTEKRQAQDPDVRNFADNTLPVLDQHLGMAQALQDALAQSDARDGAMGGRKPMGNSAFDHVSSPANPASTGAAAAAPATSTSMGIH